MIGAVGSAHAGRARAWIREQLEPLVAAGARHVPLAARSRTSSRQLILGNVATEILFATALGLFARALGFPLSIADLLVINLSTSLFASLIPVPGGIGVVEGGLVVGLSSAGDGAVGGVRGGAALPHLDVLPAADLGLVRDCNWLRRNQYL